MNESPLSENLKKELNLLKRTIRIYCVIEEEEPIGISKLSEKLEIPEHKVRYSLRMLEKEKMIKPSPVGATLTDKHLKFKEELKQLLKDISGLTGSLYDDLCE
ncbi:MAG: hypothetical protein ACOC1V_06940 [Candidatus Saliniplasma sp.]